MENKEKNIDDLFKDGLGDYTELPPPAVWDRLEKKLGGIPTKKPGQYYRWLGYFAMVSLLLLLGVSVTSNLTGIRLYHSGNAAIIAGQISKDKNSIIGQISKDKKDKNSMTGQVSDDKNDKNAFRVTDINKTTQNTKSLPANKKKSGNKYTDSHSSKRNSKGKPSDEDVYNSSVPGATLKPTSQNPNEQSTGKAKELAAIAPKSTTPKSTINNHNEDVLKQKTRPYFPRFELGVKAGYETGFDNDAAKKAVVSPYLQYNLTPKWSVMLQPAIKSSFLSSRIIGSPQSYYKVNNDGKVTLIDSIPVVIQEGSSFDTALWHRYYAYAQSHDSIVKTSVIGGAYMEFEIPVLLKYYLSKRFSVYGGVNIIYSKLISVTENTSTSKPIARTVIKDTFSEQPPTMPPISDVITYTGTPISSYTGPQYPSVQSSLLRCGYMLGFSYQYDKRWLFDALVQQASVPANVQGSYNINSALSSAYLRLTIGYKLTK